MDELFTKTITDCIPLLDNNHHKGQAGRIGIVGGSLEYTGAPYFAGISALKVGADLVHIFCASAAGTVIKAYSPELIVHPLLDHTNAVIEITPWLDRLHAIVIGPGLGRDAEILTVVTNLIYNIKNRKIPLVIDADGLFLVTQNPTLLKDFESAVILTPNQIEYERLCNKTNGIDKLIELNKNIVILKKGLTDEVFCANTEVLWKSNSGGSGRRCGGQGDILSGAIATFLNWNLSNMNQTKISTISDKSLMAGSMACYAASNLVRLCNKKAFDVKGRSMLATDMIEYIHEAFEELFHK